jgi:hypothetical protein
VAVPFFLAVSKNIISFDGALDLLRKPINKPLPVTAIFSDVDGMTAFEFKGVAKQFSAEGLGNAGCTLSHYEQILARDGETALHVFFPRIGRLILFFRALGFLPVRAGR